MFLRPLSNEQKELFLGLATKAAEANDEVEASEQMLLDAYADEMGIRSEDASKLELDEILSRLKNVSDKIELNQIAFEIAGMMLSDHEYDDAEKEFVDKMIKVFDISKERVDKMFQCVQEYMDLIKKINILLFEE